MFEVAHTPAAVVLRFGRAFWQNRSSPTMPVDLLYVSADGMLEALGFSQVVRLVEGLAHHGWRYSVLSLEKPKDLADTKRVRFVEERMAAANIRWHRMAYDASGGGRAAVQNLKRLSSGVIEHLSRKRYAGVHARSYHAAVAANAGWLATKTPWLFDTRSYWIDERIEEGRWFTTPIRVAVARGIERQLYTSAAGFVTLTELHANDLREGKHGALNDRPVVCIPTCADFNDFRPRATSELTAIPPAIRERFQGKPVIGIIGALNASYLIDETLRFVSHAMRAHSTLQLLVLSGQKAAYEAALKEHRIAPERVLIQQAPHDHMPQWLNLIRYGMLLLQPNSAAKRASMPTKLAELFATGVEPIQYGCSSEVSDWVRTSGLGQVLPDVRDETLASRAKALSLEPLSKAQINAARKRTQGHFSLERGIERYHQILQALFVRPMA